MEGEGKQGRRRVALVAVVVATIALLALLFAASANMFGSFPAGEKHDEPKEDPNRPTMVSGDRELDEMLDAAILNGIGENNGEDDEALRRAYDYVANNYTYLKQDETLPEGEWKQWSIDFAKELVNNGEGNCYRSASLMCWLARRLGYDAKAVVGTVPTTSGHGTHGWVEVAKDGQTYVIDATFHRSAPDRNYFMVTYDESPVGYQPYVPKG